MGNGSQQCHQSGAVERQVCHSMPQWRQMIRGSVLD